MKELDKSTLPEELRNFNTRSLLPKLTPGEDPDAVVRDAMCALLGLPSFDQYPRPRTAANWSFREWAEHGARWGYSASRETAHGQLFEHPDLGAVYHPAKTSGDIRSRMNCMQDARSAFRDALDAMAWVFVQAEPLLEANMKIPAYTEIVLAFQDGSFSAVRPYLKPLIQLMIRWRLGSESLDGAPSSSLSSSGLVEVHRRFRSVMRKIEEKLEMHPRVALKQIPGLGVDSSDVERIVEGLKQPDNEMLRGLQVTAAFVDTLELYLDVEIEVREQAREAKRSGRAPVIAPKTAAERYAIALARVHAEIDRASKMVTDTLADLDKAVEQSAVITLQSLETIAVPLVDEVMVADLKAAMAENAQLRSDVASMAHKVRGAESRLLECEQLVNLADKESHVRKEYDAFLNFVLEQVSKKDFMEVAMALVEMKKEATARKEAMK